MQEEIENLELVDGVKKIYKILVNLWRFMWRDLQFERICWYCHHGKHRGLSTIYIEHNLFHQIILAETFSSRTSTLFFSSLLVMWCKLERLVHNWDSDRSCLIGIDKQHLFPTVFYWLTCRHAQMIDYVFVQTLDLFPQNFISRTGWIIQKFWTMNTQNLFILQVF